MSIWLKTARKNRLAEITKTLSLELEHVGDRDWLDSISIFGSWAKDSFTGQSDLDLLVLTKHESTDRGELECIGFKLG
jgi:predicted nucleotidyltransferase